MRTAKKQLEKENLEEKTSGVGEEGTADFVGQVPRCWGKFRR